MNAMALVSRSIPKWPLMEVALTFLDGPPNVDGKRRVYLVPSSSLEEAPTYRKVSDIPIRDLRGQEDNLHIETHGFQFVKRPSRFHLTPDQNDNVDQYLVEMTAIVKETLKADAVICYDYKVSFLHASEY